MKNKILAIVRFNAREAFVLRNDVYYKYTRYNDIIIGTDGSFYVVYKKGHCGPNWKAFAGRKFTLTMADGEVINCHGQWWAGGYAEAEKIVGITLVAATISTIADLKRCYVFHGDCADAAKIKQLRKRYKGRIYDYWEYEKHIKTLKEVEAVK